MNASGIRFGLVAVLLAIAGCGGAMEAHRESRSTLIDDSASLKQVGLARAATPTAGAPADRMMSMAGETAPPAAAKTPPKTVQRKIIYTADVDLVVENFARAEQGIARLIKEVGGYLADSNVSGSPGSMRTGTWKVRVPTERFDSFVESVIGLGELQRRQTNSQDVTEEFYDLDARIKNKKVEEARLVKHLEESTGKLKDILDVEKEISRVREEIERLQGRLQLLANLTALTTVTITVREVHNYVPAESPTFATMIKRRFLASLEQFNNFLKEIVLAIVSIIPWLPVWAVVLAIAWLIYRRARHHPAFRAQRPPIEIT